VVQFLVAVAGADGRIEPAEVKTLGKIYSLLGFDVARVYADLHDLGLADEDAGPVTVQPALSSRRLHYPFGCARRAPALLLDAKRVRAKMPDRSRRGAATGVFADDAESASFAVQTQAAPRMPQSEFLRTLATRAWPRNGTRGARRPPQILLEAAPSKSSTSRPSIAVASQACEGDDLSKRTPTF
jgi:hypothetical protein